MTARLCRSRGESAVARPRGGHAAAVRVSRPGHSSGPPGARRWPVIGCLARTVWACRLSLRAAHGRGVLLTSGLPTERSRRVSGIIRQPEQAADVRAADTVPVVADRALATAGQLAQVPAGVQAALFVAGAGLGDAPGQANPRPATARSSPSRTRHSSPGCAASSCSLPWARARPRTTRPIHSCSPSCEPGAGPAETCWPTRPWTAPWYARAGSATVRAPGRSTPPPLGTAALRRPAERADRPPPNPLNPLRQPPCPHTRRTVFGLNHRFSLRRRHQTRIPERDNPRTVKGNDRP